MLTETVGSSKDFVVGRIDKKHALLHQLLPMLLGPLQSHKSEPIQQPHNYMSILPRQPWLNLNAGLRSEYTIPPARVALTSST